MWRARSPYSQHAASSEGSGRAARPCATEAVRIVKRSSSNTHNGLLSLNTPPCGVQGGPDVDRGAGGRSVEATDV